MRKQGLNVPLIGETTLLGQKVIDLAGDAANGARGHVGLSADIPVPAVEEFKNKFNARFKYVPDHNGIKGYTGVYAAAFVTRKIGKFDRKALAKTLHGMTISPKDEPGILIETTWDDKGDIDRISFIAEVVGRQAEDHRRVAEAREVTHLSLRHAPALVPAHPRLPLLTPKPWMAGHQGVYARHRRAMPGHDE